MRAWLHRHYWNLLVGYLFVLVVCFASIYAPGAGPGLVIATGLFILLSILAAE